MGTRKSHDGLPHALYRTAQVRQLDRIAIQEYGIPGYELMQRAGAALWDLINRRWPQARHLSIVCGPGNNGGDGFVLARLAHLGGMAVTVSQPVEGGGGDALTARQAWLDSGGHIATFTPEMLRDADVIVDALLGTGLDRPLTSPWTEIVAAVNAQAAPVVAVDLPSGLHADSGRVLGSAVRAHVSMSFIGLKQGLFTGEGRHVAGQIEFDDLQVPAAVYLSVQPQASRLSADVLARLLPKRPRHAHKGAFGHVLIIGGDHGMAGAVRLAGEAAARSGAGLVTVATRPAHAAAMAAARPELMWHGVGRGRELVPLMARADVVAVGPGLGRERWATELLALALDSAKPLVVDADGLNGLTPGARRDGPWILTPHPGEAARLLVCSTAEVEADRFAAVARLTQNFDAVAVLKGAGSLVRAPDQPWYVCDAGNPGMAGAGMGDTLTGVIAALWAQGLDAEDAARAGCVMHAAAGDVAARDGERGMLASDLLAQLRPLANPSGDAS